VINNYDKPIVRSVVWDANPPTLIFTDEIAANGGTKTFTFSDDTPTNIGYRVYAEGLEKTDYFNFTDTLYTKYADGEGWYAPGKTTTITLNANKTVTVVEPQGYWNQ